MNKCVFVSKIRLVEPETKSVICISIEFSHFPFFLQIETPLQQPKVSDITAQIALVLDITTVFIATSKAFKMVARQALMDVFCCLVLLIMETGERGKCDPEAGSFQAYHVIC